MSSWKAHVAAFRRSHPNVPPQQVFKQAARTYVKKGKRKQKGGNFWDDVSDFGNGFVDGFTGAAEKAAPFIPLLVGAGKKKRGRPRKQKGGLLYDLGTYQNDPLGRYAMF